MPGAAASRRPCMGDGMAANHYLRRFLRCRIACGPATERTRQRAACKMAGVDGAAEAVEQMKLQQQEKSKEELVRRRLGRRAARWRQCRGAPPPHVLPGRPHGMIALCSTCAHQIADQSAAPRCLGATGSAAAARRLPLHGGCTLVPIRVCLPAAGGGARGAQEGQGRGQGGQGGGQGGAGAAQHHCFPPFTD